MARINNPLVMIGSLERGDFADIDAVRQGTGAPVYEGAPEE